MKTKLPSGITTLDEATKFLRDLVNNDETYHPDDPAEDIVPGKHIRRDPYRDGGTCAFLFTIKESRRLNLLMNQVFSFAEFDPYEYPINLGKMRYARACKKKKNKNLIN